ncbi:gfo/Idh/MocA family oxidoreductase [Ochrobactrum sp. MYb15]|uniref:Gfo/Idh/MocA family protein n=1 Tax=Brucella TaxID=234 RepID=UPI0004643E09|nr:Gfo/Idh/MocA family oxidoreductase [Brucella rhizosphaerae]PQZ48070.1 gfo/Idh/MocA family oxidoreductase [Ochrobactrum sp. MYb19]PRA49515.1 gfo/Idh/MocA family oxidoreductase [Ochrobactrum sp. MYb68]PRA64255.1 gfo/Idh/MocA family oxidoreductase [Ochrobactrum sp. MYb18]PRA75236.1 gfo/Idh/MocA family oxidoreductase [Brucella thiophenivorans]PRA89554.1 gfo/Idh/MocA family oxidoreductase [Ochrobactrum sp. MYb14]PRA96583.1 gfo/Idh/MocA family oxidoreductase [Ochrobactrum sp. MYb15]
MNIAIIGTGFVADYYMTTLRNYPQLKLLGAFDRSGERLKVFAAHYNVRAYESFEAILADKDVQIVLNLTTPESHYAISRAALEAGKHVYSEKPLAMDFNDAKVLVEFASANGLTLAAAPANGLSDAQKLVSKSMSEIGTPRLVYAEMEDGPVFRDKWATWRSQSGAPWPGLHEFEIGCTLEHAGYALSWLVSLFGPVESVTAFSSITFQDKGPGTEHLHMAPDFSVGCLRFKSGLVARLTSGLAMPKDRSLTIVADKGSITVDDLWDNRSAVRLESTTRKRSILSRVFGRVEAKLGKTLPWKPAVGSKLAYPKGDTVSLPSFPSQIDFMRGVADQARAIETGKTAFFSGVVALHITEVALALNNAGENAAPYKVQSTF